MGCTYSVYRKKKSNFPEVVVLAPSTRIPVQCDLQRALKGLVPRDLADKLSSLRNQIVLVAEDTGGSAIAELRRALNEYLCVVIGLTKKGFHNFFNMVKSNWQDGSIANAWFEVLSAVHFMAMLTLSEADSLMIPKDNSGSGFRVVSSDSKREAIDLLLKASGYLEFCVRHILTRIPAETKYVYIDFKFVKLVLEENFEHPIKKLPSHHIQENFAPGLAGGCVGGYSYSSTRPGCDINQEHGKKHLRFIKWKFLEAKAAAYYYHGLILDKGNEPSNHIGAVSCFLAAEELLAESKKACLSFCLAAPVTRAPPPWGAMKHLNQKIPEVASRKSQMYGYLLEQEKGLQALPDLPEFQLSLRPDDYELPEIDPAWDSENWKNLGQPLKEHLRDSDEGPTDTD
ncbi:BRO1 domain [Sesbania bispinosa]|nr:BRO1 domain [Sesbania bispinosa]